MERVPFISSLKKVMEWTQKLKNSQNWALLFWMCYINITNDTLFAGSKFEKLSTGKLNILSISWIIFHKVCGPVTCWEVVVHHLSAVYSMMDGMLLQTHRALNISVRVLGDNSCWESSIKTNCNMEIVFALLWEKCCSLVLRSCEWDENCEICWKRSCTKVCSLQ